MTAGEIAQRSGGTVVSGDPGTVVSSFAFDSRALAPHACFVALQGHRDGHDFVHDAFDRGAVCALVSRAPAGLHDDRVTMVRVDDPQRALARIARSVRETRTDLTVIGITGSTGKTSTKDLLHAALSTTGSVHANRDSFNNEVGLPLTLLEMDDTTRYVITEMGARFAGNIAELCEIAEPNIGIVTNIGLAHAQHLGGPEGIAQVKGELLEALPASGLAVLNADDEWAERMAARAACEVRTVGLAPHADVRITDVAIDDELRARFRIDDVEIEVPLRGEHQVHNAALAVTVARHLGLDPADVVAGLAAARGSRWRMELERTPGGVVVLNDAYNANPTSMAAAVRALAHLPVPGRRIAVLGEMLELGSHAPDAHAAIGRLLAELGIDRLVAVGDGGRAIAAGAAPTATTVVRDATEALTAVEEVARAGDAVLVKASRAVGLEKIATALVATEAATT